MPSFTVIATREQVQSISLKIEAENQKEAEKIASYEINFGEIDQQFDEGEVVYITYEVKSVKPNL